MYAVSLVWYRSARGICTNIQHPYRCSLVYDSLGTGLCEQLHIHWNISMKWVNVASFTQDSNTFLLNWWWPHSKPNFYHTAGEFRKGLRITIMICNYLHLIRDKQCTFKGFWSKQWLLRQRELHYWLTLLQSSVKHFQIVIQNQSNKNIWLGQWIKMFFKIACMILEWSNLILFYEKQYLRARRLYSWRLCQYPSYCSDFCSILW